VRIATSTNHDYWWYHSDYTTLGGSLTWQANDRHQIKTGLESRQYDLGEFWASGVGGGIFGNSSDASFLLWNQMPKSMNWYIQDKIEFSDMVINVGLRYDRLDPNSTYPDPTRELGYEYMDDSGIAHIIEPSELSQLTEQENETLKWGYMERDSEGNLASFTSAPKAPVKSQWSPRLGIGYPITDRTAFHFSYGQFYQFPDLINMYNYSNYQGHNGRPPGWSDEANSMAQDFLYGNPYYPFPYNITDWYIPEVGTPNVNPQRSTQYETGLRTRIGNQYLLTMNLYYKDMFDYIASKRYDADPSQYAIYENMDYANSRGLEMSFQKLYSAGLDWEINYTLSRAEGNAPTSDYHWYVAEWANGYDWQDFNHTYTMPWDQTHNINFRLNYIAPSGLGLSMIGSYGSGFPYTPEDARARPIDKQYSGRMPSTSNVDLKIYYDLKMKNLNIRLFGDISNAMNKANVLAVDNTTGEPDATLDSGQPAIYVWKPYYFSPPRHIEIGISVAY
jgi:outer membrane receptor protein involved in Fe transport